MAQFQTGAGNERTTSTTQLQSWLAALTHVAPSLDRTGVALFDAVAEFPWLALPDAGADAWIRFVCALVSARGEWVGKVAALSFQNMTLRA